MTETQAHTVLVAAIFLMAGVTLVSQILVVAPYGRHFRAAGWGPVISNRLGWVVMEFPAVAVFCGVYGFGSSAWQVAPLAFLALWNIHYLNRAFIYPLRTRTAHKQIPAAVVAAGFAFNLVNAYVNARYVSEIGTYATDWLADPRFVLGAAMFASGFALNIHSDNILVGLRDSGGSGYFVPRSGAFRLVSCPNYLGELLEWAGWALSTWSLGGLGFFIHTAAYLVPRSMSNHAWYRAQFDDYPEGRRALIPKIW